MAYGEIERYDQQYRGFIRDWTKRMEVCQSTNDPDWKTLEEEILCPLCDYNLRGLVEPRCPECGYRFDWPELLDPSRRLHPYVFEHHPERNIWSFWKTVRGTLLPRRFWTTLHPAQPSRMRRLVFFVLLIAGVNFFSFCTATIAPMGYEIARSMPAQKKRFIQWSKNPQAAEWVARLTRDYGSFDDFLATEFPAPFSLAFVDLLIRDHPEIFRICYWSLLYLSWPLLSFASLMIFQWSMRKAKVNKIQIWRCLAYSFDAAFWVGLLAMATMAPALWFGVVTIVGLYYSGILTIAILSLLVMIYRLTVAYRAYLRFDHPVSTVLASQCITFLVAFNLLLLDILW